MDEDAICHLVRAVEDGRLSRRAFIHTLSTLGIAAPLASHVLAATGVAHAQAPAPAFQPRRRGGGGHLKTLWWQAPTLLNPHLAVGVKDYDGARLFYEPLVSFDPDGDMIPVLAEEIPSVQNGSVARDGMSVTWRLKRDVRWHDGKPFTADDVIFNWEYAADPATAASTRYEEVERMERLDAHTVKMLFKKPMPFWPAIGSVLLIPRHVFEPYKGARSREAPGNLKPVGTGPYRFVEFRPGDLVKAEINPHYHVLNRPFFDMVEMKGGGDAVSAARAVLQTGEYDYAWNLQVEDEILKRLEQGGKGKVVMAFAGMIEHIQCNQTDPVKEVDGERSSVKTVHPFLTDPAVRAALALLVDRGGIQENIYGRTGAATANFLNAPTRFQSRNTRWEFNPDKANRILDAAGWSRGHDGIRTKNGKRLRLLFQTSVNAPRQKTQAIVKQSAARAGIEIELKTVSASAYFSSDPANPDTVAHFYADLQLLAYFMAAPDPENFMKQFLSWEVAAKENKWQRRNVTRWRHDEYDRLFRAAEVELDPIKRAALFIRMNDLVVEHGVVIPVVWRSKVTAVSNRLRGAVQNGWDWDFWNLPYWYREA